MQAAAEPVPVRTGRKASGAGPTIESAKAELQRRAAARAAKRAANDGWLVPPPMPLAELAKVAADSGTMSRGFLATKNWLTSIAEADGTGEDLWKAFRAWVPGILAYRHIMRETLDPLVAEAEGRKWQLNVRIGEEEQPVRNVQTLRSRLQEYQRVERDAEAQLSEAKTNTARCRERLAEAERVLAAQRAKFGEA